MEHETITYTSRIHNKISYFNKEIVDVLESKVQVGEEAYRRAKINSWKANFWNYHQQPKKNSEFFCGTLCMICRFLHTILHSVLRFKAVKKSIPQLQIPVEIFSLMNRKVFENFCSNLYISIEFINCKQRVKYQLIYKPQLKCTSGNFWKQAIL